MTLRIGQPGIYEIFCDNIGISQDDKYKLEEVCEKVKGVLSYGFEKVSGKWEYDIGVSSKEIKDKLIQQLHFSQYDDKCYYVGFYVNIYITRAFSNCRFNQRKIEKLNSVCEKILGVVSHSLVNKAKISQITGFSEDSSPGEFEEEPPGESLLKEYNIRVSSKEVKDQLLQALSQSDNEQVRLGPDDYFFHGFNVKINLA